VSEHPPVDSIERLEPVLDIKPCDVDINVSGPLSAGSSPRRSGRSSAPRAAPGPENGSGRPRRIYLPSIVPAPALAEAALDQSARASQPWSALAFLGARLYGWSGLRLNRLIAVPKISTGVSLMPSPNSSARPL
jgi:hypothetical protein